MKKIAVAVIAGILMAGPAFGWGREGHETVAKIAENHLKPSAKKKIEKYLDGKSIVYYAKWMDDYRETAEYGFTTRWHVNRVDENGNYVHDQKHGDAIYGLELAIGALENYKELSDSAVAVNLKYIIHLVGDMHCPAHVYYADKGQKYRVKVGGKEMAVHKAWDEGIIQHMRIFSSTEWAAEIDRLDKREREVLMEGEPRDWLSENYKTCRVQFDLARPGEALNKDDLNAAIYLIEDQLLKAGLRLAAVLNELF